MDRLKPYEDKLKAYIKNANPWLSLAQNELYTDAIFQASVAHQVDFRLIAGIITIESSYRHNAVSSSGALGMGQLKVSTAQWLGVANPLEPVENIHGTAKYIRFLMDRFNQDMDKALASYFQGQGTIERYGISEISRAYLVKLSQALSQFETLADARIPS
jgi:soluble lytic murein transglycosylase-like protein